MAYFVTGATGFIGSYLVAKLVERSGPIYVLVRKQSLDRLAELRDAWGVDDKRVIAIVGDLGKRSDVDIVDWLNRLERELLEPTA